LAAAWKSISSETWDRVNNTLFEYTKKEKIITGTDFRLDSTRPKRSPINPPECEQSEGM